MLEPQPVAARDQRGQIGGVVGGAGATAKQHDGVVEHRAINVSVRLQPRKEPGDLLAEEQVVFGERELSIFVASV